MNHFKNSNEGCSPQVLKCGIGMFCHRETILNKVSYSEQAFVNKLLCDKVIS